LHKATVEYLRILKLAAETMESTVELALADFLEKDTVPLADSIRKLVAPEKPEIPKLEEPIVDLGEFDDLLEALTRNGVAVQQ